MLGMFDSGVGGLGVLAATRDILPDADIAYVADQANSPYGVRSLHEVEEASVKVSRALIGKGAETIVIACNTASAAALHLLRELHPGTRFVGMEPAVKPAALKTRTGVIGVLATEATFQGQLFASVVDRFAEGTTVVTAACPEWVELVEKGDLEGPVVEAEVTRRISPLVAQGADTLVLGCTHFPFLIDTIRSVVGPDVTIVDPAPAVARQTSRVHPAGGQGGLRLYTTGDPQSLGRRARGLIGVETAPALLTF